MTQEWTNALNDDPIPWLVEEDAPRAWGRYFSLWDLIDKPLDDAHVFEALQAVMCSGMLPSSLGNQDPNGY